jgi:hypothetical protein
MDHPELVPTLGTLSSACRRNGNYGDARKFCQRAIDLLDHHGLGKHPHATALMAQLASFDEPSGRDSEPTPAIAARRPARLDVYRIAGVTAGLLANRKGSKSLAGRARRSHARCHCP